MKYYYIEYSDKRVSLTEEQYLKVKKILQDREIRFIEIDELVIGIGYIKEINRDYERENLENKSGMIKKETKEREENKETMEAIDEMKKELIDKGILSF